jgi:phenylalanyl-tRNA synthetase alpha chain
MIPEVLSELAHRDPQDEIVLCPGICYRRDVVDRTHTGEPHQLDIWRIKRGEPRLQRPQLIELIETLIQSLIPGTRYRANETIHPYTVNGLEVEILVKGQWLEILECGEAHPDILAHAGLPPEEYSGLAMGMGLDRLVMAIKGIEDIRLLRASDPRIKTQMTTLQPYRLVSKYPPITHDLSISVAVDQTPEDVCETIRDAIGVDIQMLESVVILSETLYEQLPPIAIERLGIRPGQKNILVRITLRSPERSLHQEETNNLRDKIYLAVDQSGTGGYLKYGRKS